MKPRARRVTIGAAVLVAALVTVLVVAYWGTVRDHFEAWHFQLTRETMAIGPHSAALTSWTCEGPGMLGMGPLKLWGMLARYSNVPVVFDATMANSHTSDQCCWLEPGQTVRGSDALRVLGIIGWRVIEQHFPQRAYVVIWNPMNPMKQSPWATPTFISSPASE